MKLSVLIGPLDDERLPDGTVYAVRDDGHKIRYSLLRKLTITDTDTGRVLTVPILEDSDGATGAPDDPKLWIAWFGHDHVCKSPVWDDGEPIGGYTAARLIWGLIRYCGKRYNRLWFKGRAFYWSVSTYLFGCKNARENGWLK